VPEVNGAEIGALTKLNDGDLIEVGRVRLDFHVSRVGCRRDARENPGSCPEFPRMVKSRRLSSPGARSFERGGPPRSISHPSGPHSPSALGRGCYRKRRWQDAQIVFEQILERWHEDGPARMYVNRCREYFVAGPQQDWERRLRYGAQINSERISFTSSSSSSSSTSLSSCYRWRPSKRPAAEQMQMKVKHGCPAHARY